MQKKIEKTIKLLAFVLLFIINALVISASSSLLSWLGIIPIIAGSLFICYLLITTK